MCNTCAVLYIWMGTLPCEGNSHTPNSKGSYGNQYSGASFRILFDVGLLG